MLADFQQALADLTASPEECARVRRDPSLLHQNYQLTEREWRRLLGIVNHRGMQCACIVYRANRLAPLALNVPRTCKMLGPQLRDLVSEFWASSRETNVHFFVETHRFCEFLKAKIAQGASFPPDLIATFEQESAAVAAALAESHIEDQVENYHPEPAVAG
jgi:hypothetical protein